MSIFNKLSNAAIHAATGHLLQFSEDSRELRFSQKALKAFSTSIEKESLSLKVELYNGGKVSALLRPQSLFITRQEVILKAHVLESSGEALFPNVTVEGQELACFGIKECCAPRI